MSSRPDILERGPSVPPPTDNNGGGNKPPGIRPPSYGSNEPDPSEFDAIVQTIDTTTSSLGGVDNIFEIDSPPTVEEVTDRMGALMLHVLAQKQAIHNLLLQDQDAQIRQAAGELALKYRPKKTLWN